MADSPYFDSAYFDSTYFDTDVPDTGGKVGRKAIVAPPEDTDELLALI